MVRARPVRTRTQRVFGDKLQKVKRMLVRVRRTISGDDEGLLPMRRLRGMGSWKSAGSCWDMQTSIWRFLSRKYLLSSSFVNLLVSLAVVGALLETLALVALFTLLEEEQEEIHRQWETLVEDSSQGAWPVEPIG